MIHSSDEGMDLGGGRRGIRSMSIGKTLPTQWRGKLGCAVAQLTGQKGVGALEKK